MILLVIFFQRLGEKSLQSFCTSTIRSLVFHESGQVMMLLSLIWNSLCFMSLRSLACLLENSYGIMLIANADS